MPFHNFFNISTSYVVLFGERPVPFQIFMIFLLFMLCFVRKHPCFDGITIGTLVSSLGKLSDWCNCKIISRNSTEAIGWMKHLSRIFSYGSKIWTKYFRVRKWWGNLCWCDLICPRPIPACNLMHRKRDNVTCTGKKPSPQISTNKGWSTNPMDAILSLKPRHSL